VGNIQLQEIENILSSNSAKMLRDSIIDGSYRYCNDKQCSWLLFAKTGKVWSEEVPFTQIKNIRLAVDDSCNLRCPSCRNKQIFVASGSYLKTRIKIIDKNTFGRIGFSRTLVRTILIVLVLPAIFTKESEPYHNLLTNSRAIRI
jgi:hypothetical protein